MKTLIALSALAFATLTHASRKVDICSEPIRVLELQLAEQEDPQAARVLLSSMQRIQQHCQQKYGQQQQQMQNLSDGQIVNPRFNPLIVCERNRNEPLRRAVLQGHCLQPSGQIHHQPQDGSGC